MRPSILPAFVLCAILLIEAKAQEQSSSGYNAEGFSSADDGSGSESSGAQDVEKMVDAMRKLNKNKSDEELSKNIKTGSFLKNIPIRTFEKLSALWISLIRRLWNVWRAKGARQVMHSIVEKLVTHTGKKVSRNVAKALDDNAQKKTKTAGSEELTHPDSVKENLAEAPEITAPQSDVQKISADQANEPTRPDASNTDVSSDSSIREPAMTGKPASASPVEKNALNEAGVNTTSTYGPVDTGSPGDEATDSDSQQKPEISNVQSDTPKALTGSSASDNQNNAGSPSSSPTKSMIDAAEVTEGKKQALTNNAANSAKQPTAVMAKSSDAATEKESNSQSTVTDDAVPGKQPDSLQSVSINVENPLKDEVKSFVNIKPKNIPDERYLVPQEQTPESISANTGSSSDSSVRKNGKKNHEKSKKRYKMHGHTANTRKHRSNGSKNSKYFNVNKHLIKRSKAKTLNQAYKHLLTKGPTYEGPISNQLESVLKANAATAPVYMKSHYDGHRRRNYAAEPRGSSDNSEEADVDASDVSSGESTLNTRNEMMQTHSKRRKLSHRNRRYRSKKLAARHRLRSPRTRTAASSSFAASNKMMPTKTAKNEAAAKKFKFFPFARNLLPDNKTLEMPAPVFKITPAAAETVTLPEDNDSESNQSEQPSPSTVQSEPLNLTPVQSDQSSVATQSEPASPVQVPLEQASPMPILLLRPTRPQSQDETPVMMIPTAAQRPIGPSFPANQPTSPTEAGTAPPSDSNDSENVTVIAQEDNSLEQPQQQAVHQNEAMFEEVRSLESRMTVLEAAVAEVIEWIRSHSNRPTGPVPSPQVSLRPALPYPRPPSLPEGLEELPRMHNPRILKQIFIPLPPPDTEAEKEIESGQPVTGLPFPLNFIVAKMLAKMAKTRDHHRIVAIHPHTPLPEINIPAIEHDINRLEKELGSVPRPLHHLRHRLRLHRPISEDGDVKHPLIGQLVSSEPEKESPECSSNCQNGGLCIGGNICRCPSPYSGPHCEFLNSMISPTGRVLIERPDDRMPQSLRRSHFDQYNPSVRQKIGDHRERRRLVSVLKSMLRNLATDSSSMRKDSIPVDDDSPDLQNQEDVGLDDSQTNEDLYQSSHSSI